MSGLSEMLFGERLIGFVGLWLCRHGLHRWTMLDFGVVGCNCSRCGKERE